MDDFKVPVKEVREQWKRCTCAPGEPHSHNGNRDYVWLDELHGKTRYVVVFEPYTAWVDRIGRVRAGCRRYTKQMALSHWPEDTPKGEAVRSLLAQFKARPKVKKRVAARKKKAR